MKGIRKIAKITKGRGIRMTEEEFIEASLRFAPPGSEIRKVQEDGYTFFEIGELNIDKAARLLLPYVKFPLEKNETEKEGGSK